MLPGQLNQILNNHLNGCFAKELDGIPSKTITMLLIYFTNKDFDIILDLYQNGMTTSEMQRVEDFLQSQKWPRAQLKSLDLRQWCIFTFKF